MNLSSSQYLLFYFYDSMATSINLNQMNNLNGPSDQQRDSKIFSSHLYNIKILITINYYYSNEKSLFC